MTRPSFSFLGLVNLVGWIHLKDELIWKAYVIPFNIAIKNNGELTRNSGGK